MKRLIYIAVSLLTVICFGQQTDKPVQEGYFEGYYITTEGDTIKLGNRSRENLAESDIRNYLASIGGGIGYVKKPRTRIEVTVKNQGGVNMVEYYKDTLIKYETTYDGEKVVESWINLRNTYHKYGDKEYLVEGKQHGEQPTQYYLDTVFREDDRSKTIKMFMTNHWQVVKNEHNNLDSLKTMSIGEFGYTPGTQIFGVDTTRRHTSTFAKKYAEYFYKDTTFNVVGSLGIRVNKSFKGDLVLDNLRIETTNSDVGMPCINGNAPSYMYFEFKEYENGESLCCDVLETIREETFRYSSHCIADNRFEKGKRYYIRAVAMDETYLVYKTPWHIILYE